MAKIRINRIQHPFFQQVLSKKAGRKGRQIEEHLNTLGDNEKTGLWVKSQKT